jgi:hypothetical protein
MSAENHDRTGSAEPPPSGQNVGDELRELAQSFAALGRTLFREGRGVSVELLRSLRRIVDRAREEIERLSSQDRRP